MLQAQLKNGNRIVLATKTKEEIEKLRLEHLFYCPVCKDQVIMKAGSKVIPHFAHQSKANCLSSQGGEGLYHEKGKFLLYQWLQSQHLDVKLEYYVKEINQRPDILLSIGNKQIAIEFQCARIPIEDIQKRNKGYNKVGIIPIWILGANQFKRIGRNILKIDNFTQQFIHQFTSDYPQTLYYFCPERLQLTFVQDLYPISLHQAICLIQFTTLQEITFPDLFQVKRIPSRTLYDQWLKEKKKFRTKYRKRSFNREKSWYLWIYQHQLHYESLSSLIHLPVESQFRMKSPPWDWQSRLCVGLIGPLEVGDVFTLEACFYYLQDHLHQTDYFSLNHSSNHPINQYLHLLLKLDILQEEEEYKYRKIKEIKHYEHVEESLEADKKLISKLIEK